MPETEPTYPVTRKFFDFWIREGEEKLREKAFSEEQIAQVSEEVRSVIDMLFQEGEGETNVTEAQINEICAKLTEGPLKGMAFLKKFRSVRKESIFMSEKSILSALTAEPKDASGKKEWSLFVTKNEDGAFRFSPHALSNWNHTSFQIDGKKPESFFYSLFWKSKEKFPDAEKMEIEGLTKHHILYNPKGIELVLRRVFQEDSSVHIESYEETRLRELVSPPSDPEQLKIHNSFCIEELSDDGKKLFRLSPYTLVSWKETPLQIAGKRSASFFYSLFQESKEKFSDAEKQEIEGLIHSNSLYNQKGIEMVLRQIFQENPFVHVESYTESVLRELVSPPSDPEQLRIHQSFCMEETSDDGKETYRFSPYALPNWSITPLQIAEKGAKSFFYSLFLNNKEKFTDAERAEIEGLIKGYQLYNPKGIKMVLKRIFHENSSVHIESCEETRLRELVSPPSDPKQLKAHQSFCMEETSDDGGKLFRLSPYSLSSWQTTPLQISGKRPASFFYSLFLNNIEKFTDAEKRELEGLLIQTTLYNPKGIEMVLRVVFRDMKNVVILGPHEGCRDRSRLLGGSSTESPSLSSTRPSPDVDVKTLYYSETQLDELTGILVLEEQGLSEEEVLSRISVLARDWGKSETQVQAKYRNVKQFLGLGIYSEYLENEFVSLAADMENCGDLQNIPREEISSIAKNLNLDPAKVLRRFQWFLRFVMNWNSPKQIVRVNRRKLPELAELGNSFWEFAREYSAHPENFQHAGVLPFVGYIGRNSSYNLILPIEFKQDGDYSLSDSMLIEDGLSILAEWTHPASTSAESMVAFEDVPRPLRTVEPLELSSPFPTGVSRILDEENQKEYVLLWSQPETWCSDAAESHLLKLLDVPTDYSFPKKHEYCISVHMPLKVMEYAEGDALLTR